MITENDLSQEQKVIYNHIIKWCDKPDDKLLIFSGVAGSGKSTITSLVAKQVNRSIAFACFTGKAANVLRQKLDTAKIQYSYCGTIHGLMYIPIVDKYSLKVTGWRRKPFIEEELIFIDEASMVSDRIFRDLQSYGKKIVAIGDHCQLPPIASSLNLMEFPHLMLTEIHRTALDNPIIKLSQMIRQGEDIDDFEAKDERVQLLSKKDDKIDQYILNMFKEPKTRLDSAVLCYFNNSRVRINSIIREALGFSEEPDKDDVVICLKNTQVDEDKAIFNGMRGMVDYCVSLNQNYYNADINFPYENIKINEELCKHQFNNQNTFQSPLDLKEFGLKAKSWGKVGLLFDFGYALTYYKSQGSEYDNVVVFVERSKFQSDDDFRRAMYTAVTRSSNNLILAI